MEPVRVEYAVTRQYFMQAMLAANSRSPGSMVLLGGLIALPSFLCCATIAITTVCGCNKPELWITLTLFCLLMGAVLIFLLLILPLMQWRALEKSGMTAQGS